MKKLLVLLILMFAGPALSGCFYYHDGWYGHGHHGKGGSHGGHGSRDYRYSGERR